MFFMYLNILFNQLVSSEMNDNNWLMLILKNNIISSDTTLQNMSTCSSNM